MDSEGILTGIAEVGVALAGFAALVAIFRRTQGPLKHAAMLAVRTLIELSLSIVFFAFLPLVLFQFELSATAVWFGASLATVSIGTGLQLLSAARLRLLYGEGWRAPSWWYYILGLSIAAVALGAQVVNLFVKGPALYIAGLLAMIVIASLQFLASVAGRWRSESDNDVDSAHRSSE